MSDICIRMVVFVVTMLFLVFSGVLAVVLKFMFRNINGLIDNMFKDIDTLIDNEMYSVTSYEKFVKKWEEYIVFNSNQGYDFENVLYLRCEKDNMKVVINVIRNCKKYNSYKVCQEIVSIRVFKNNSLCEDRLWYSSKFMSYKWFVMDRIMMKYFGLKSGKNGNSVGTINED